MSSRLKLIEAAILHEKSKALAEIAAAESLLENIGNIPGEDYLGLLIEHSRKIVAHEHTMNALQLYFLKTPPPVSRQPKEVKPAPDPMINRSPPGAEPITHEELLKRSPTYKKSVEGQPSPQTKVFKESLKDKFDEPKS